MTSLGKQLFLLRTSKGLSQNKLASLANVPQSAISEIEAGKRKNPGIACLRQLAAALGVTLPELLESDPSALRDPLAAEAETT